jgi:hypothetical protein
MANLLVSCDTIRAMTTDPQADLADVGRALAALQTIITRMLNKADLAHITDACAAELTTLDRAVRALVSPD